MENAIPLSGFNSLGNFSIGSISCFPLDVSAIYILQKIYVQNVGFCFKIKKSEIWGIYTLHIFSKFQNNSEAIFFSKANQQNIDFIMIPLTMQNRKEVLIILLYLQFTG